jgi:hypothetical protein
MDIAFFANQLQGLVHDPGFVNAAYGRFCAAHNNNAPNQQATLMFVGDVFTFLNNQRRNQQPQQPKGQQVSITNQQGQQSSRLTQQRQNKPGQKKPRGPKVVSERKDGGGVEKKKTKKPRGKPKAVSAKKQAAAQEKKA